MCLLQGGHSPHLDARLCVHWAEAAAAERLQGLLPLLRSQNWAEAADAERLQGLLPLLRSDLCGRGRYRGARQGPCREGEVHAVPSGVGADGRSGHWRALLQNMRKAARHLCLLQVTDCCGLRGGVHLDTQLPAPCVHVRALRAPAWRSGLRPVLDKRVEVRLSYVQSTPPHDADVTIQGLRITVGPMGIWKWPGEGRTYEPTMECKTLSS